MYVKNAVSGGDCPTCARISVGQRHRRIAGSRMGESAALFYQIFLRVEAQGGTAAKARVSRASPSWGSLLCRPVAHCLQSSHHQALDLARPSDFCLNSPTGTGTAEPPGVSAAAGVGSGRTVPPSASASRADDAERRVLPHVCCSSPGAGGAAAAALPGLGGRSWWQLRPGKPGGSAALSVRQGALVASRDRGPAVMEHLSLEVAATPLRLIAAKNEKSRSELGRFLAKQVRTRERGKTPGRPRLPCSREPRGPARSVLL